MDATAHLPTGYVADLRGAMVQAPDGRWYGVVGDPVPLPAGTVPGPWDRAVPLREVDAL